MKLPHRAQRAVQEITARSFDATGIALLPALLRLRPGADRERERLLASINDEGVPWYKGL